MRIKDFGFSTLLSAGVLLIGLAAIVIKEPLGQGYLGEPLIGRNANDVKSWPFGSYAKLRNLDRATLDERERIARLAQQVEAIRLLNPRQEWRGVVFCDKSRISGGLTALKARYGQDAGFEEGIPCHFLVDETGTLTATERWLKQKRCLSKGLKQAQEWIVVFSLKPQPQPILEVLLSAPWSLGYWAESGSDGRLVARDKSPFAKDD